MEPGWFVRFSGKQADVAFSQEIRAAQTGTHRSPILTPHPPYSGPRVVQALRAAIRVRHPLLPAVTRSLRSASAQHEGGRPIRNHWGKPGTPPRPRKITARFQVFPQTPFPASPRAAVVPAARMTVERASKTSARDRGISPGRRAARGKHAYRSAPVAWKPPRLARPTRIQHRAPEAGSLQGFRGLCGRLPTLFGLAQFSQTCSTVLAPLPRSIDGWSDILPPSGPRQVCVNFVGDRDHFGELAGRAAPVWLCG